MPAKKPARKTCFVIGPIGSAGSDERRHADMLLNAIIREVLERSGEFDYLVKRADEDADPGMINDRVIHDILNSDLAIADLSFLNPNAFWELGLRHSAMKPVIHMAAEGTKLPFDNIGHRAIFVDLGDWESNVAARKSLAEATKAIEVADYKVSNPITQANASIQFSQSTDTSEQILGSVLEMIRAMDRRIEELEDRPPELANKLRYLSDKERAMAKQFDKLLSDSWARQGYPQSTNSLLDLAEVATEELPDDDNPRM